MPARSDGHLSHLELRGNLAVGHAIHEDTLHDGALGGGQPIHHLHDLLELPVYILIVKLGEVQLLQAMQVKELLPPLPFPLELPPHIPGDPGQPRPGASYFFQRLAWLPTRDQRRLLNDVVRGCRPACVPSRRRQHTRAVLLYPSGNTGATVPGVGNSVCPIAWGGVRASTTISRCQAEMFRALLRTPPGFQQATRPLPLRRRVASDHCFRNPTIVRHSLCSRPVPPRMPCPFLLVALIICQERDPGGHDPGART